MRMGTMDHRRLMRWQLFREVQRRERPIYFFALAQAELSYKLTIVRLVMDTKGRITPHLWRPYRGWGDEVIYFPNYFQAWAQLQKLAQSSDVY